MLPTLNYFPLRALAVIYNLNLWQEPRPGCALPTFDLLKNNQWYSHIFCFYDGVLGVQKEVLQIMFFD